MVSYQAQRPITWVRWTRTRGSPEAYPARGRNGIAAGLQ